MKKTVITITALVLLAIGVSQVNIGIIETAADAEYKTRTVIIDAGHGGEDGGTVAADGTAEKEINLLISQNLAALFDFFGVNYRTVRDTDISVGDAKLDTVRKRKVSDILNRESIVNSYPESILLSIHQNHYSDSKCSGTQVFYSGNCEDSSLLAENIQKSVRSHLQPENNRLIKLCGSSVYLLHKAQTTAVLVECGFLSNPSETEKLKTDIYRKQMSLCICTGLLEFLNNSDITDS